MAKVSKKRNKYSTYSATDLEKACSLVKTCISKRGTTVETLFCVICDIRYHKRCIVSITNGDMQVHERELNANTACTTICQVCDSKESVSQM